eukprot:2889264-Pleurochrysis_carterae.AAC.3
MAKAPAADGIEAIAVDAGEDEAAAAAVERAAAAAAAEGMREDIAAGGDPDEKYGAAAPIVYLRAELAGHARRSTGGLPHRQSSVAPARVNALAMRLLRACARADDVRGRANAILEQRARQESLDYEQSTRESVRRRCCAARPLASAGTLSQPMRQHGGLEPSLHQRRSSAHCSEVSSG